jgi:hypothetical protein
MIHLINACVILVLALAWSKTGALDFCIKVGLFTLGLVGVLTYLHVLGNIP